MKHRDLTHEKLVGNPSIFPRYEKYIQSQYVIISIEAIFTEGFGRIRITGLLEL